MVAGASINVPSQAEMGAVWNSLPIELRELLWHTSMVGALSILSVAAGVAVALMLVVVP